MASAEKRPFRISRNQAHDLLTGFPLANPYETKCLSPKNASDHLSLRCTLIEKRPLACVLSREAS